MAEDDVIFNGKKEYSGRRFYSDDGKDKGEDWRDPLADRSEAPGAPSEHSDIGLINSAQ